MFWFISRNKLIGNLIWLRIWDVEEKNCLNERSDGALFSTASSLPRAFLSPTKAATVQPRLDSRPTRL